MSAREQGAATLPDGTTCELRTEADAFGRCNAETFTVHGARVSIQCMVNAPFMVSREEAEHRWRDMVGRGWIVASRYSLIPALENLPLMNRARESAHGAACNCDQCSERFMWSLKIQDQFNAMEVPNG